MIKRSGSGPVTNGSGTRRPKTSGSIRLDAATPNDMVSSHPRLEVWWKITKNNFYIQVVLEDEGYDPGDTIDRYRKQAL
jgi:hypothetical protein